MGLPLEGIKIIDLPRYRRTACTQLLLGSRRLIKVERPGSVTSPQAARDIRTSMPCILRC